MQPSYLVHPRARQSRMVPERLHDALRAAGRGRVMAPHARSFGSVDVGSPGGAVTGYDPSVDRPGTMVFVDMNIVQCGLNAHGAHLGVDGRWGPQTALALASFVSLLVVPASSDGAGGLPPYPAQFSFVAPTAGGTSVKMSQPLRAALLDHTDTGPCIQAVVDGGHGHASTTTSLDTGLAAPAASGVPTWLYWALGIGTAVGLGAWAFSASKKRKGR